MKKNPLLKYIFIMLSTFSLIFVHATNADISTSTILNPPIDDSSIISRAQSAIELNPLLSGESITVSSNHGVVTLEGEVSNQSKIDIAVKIAKETSGVIEVKSDLTIKLH